MSPKGLFRFHSWLIKGGDPGYLLNGMVLQAIPLESLQMYEISPKNGSFENSWLGKQVKMPFPVSSPHTWSFWVTHGGPFLLRFAKCWLIRHRRGHHGHVVYGGFCPGDGRHLGENGHRLLRKMIGVYREIQGMTNYPVMCYFINPYPFKDPY